VLRNYDSIKSEQLAFVAPARTAASTLEVFSDAGSRPSFVRSASSDRPLESLSHCFQTGYQEPSQKATERVAVSDQYKLRMFYWTSILSFSSSPTLQIINLWILPQAIPRRRRVKYPCKTE
jgi:hypothetical protein